jgi:hypothetical protein
LSSPHREALNQRNKQIERKKIKKITRKKIPTPKKYFPGDFFLKRTQFFSRVFELPLPRNAQKRTKKKKNYVRTFFCELAQMYVVFSGFFFCRPSVDSLPQELNTQHSTEFFLPVFPFFLDCLLFYRVFGYFFGFGVSQLPAMGLKKHCSYKKLCAQKPRRKVFTKKTTEIQHQINCPRLFFNHVFWAFLGEGK